MKPTKPKIKAPAATTSSSSSSSASAATTATPSLVTHNSIAERARRIWEQRGQPADRDLEIWLEAERQLQNGGGSRPVRDQIRPKAGEIEADDAVSSEVEKELDEDIEEPKPRRSATSL